VSDILSSLKRAHKTGEGPQTLRERREQERLKAQQAEIDAVSFNALWDPYYKQCKVDKGKRTYVREESLWRLWIQPSLGEIKIKDPKMVDHLGALKEKMAEAGCAPRSITYALAVIRQMYNYARSTGQFDNVNPVSLVKKPTSDNRRFRFFTKEEARQLLDTIRPLSQETHDMTLLSLSTGMRAGEIFALTVGDVDLIHKLIMIKDTKNVHNRVATLTPKLKAMLKPYLADKKPTDLVFPDARGRQRIEISHSFDRAVASLGFNKDVTDRRQQVVFHTCRHTFASWLAQKGVPLYVIQKLMGHETSEMTERYAHLCPQNFTDAATLIDL